MFDLHSRVLVCNNSSYIFAITYNEYFLRSNLSTLLVEVNGCENFKIIQVFELKRLCQSQHASSNGMDLLRDLTWELVENLVNSHDKLFEFTILSHYVKSYDFGQLPILNLKPIVGGIYTSNNHTNNIFGRRCLI